MWEGIEHESGGDETDTEEKGDQDFWVRGLRERGTEAGECVKTWRAHEENPSMRCAH